MREAFAMHGLQCKSFSHFFNKKYWRIWDVKVWSFNSSLTNDVVSFEQPGPVLKLSRVDWFNSRLYFDCTVQDSAIFLNTTTSAIFISLVWSLLPEDLHSELIWFIKKSHKTFWIIAAYLIIFSSNKTLHVGHNQKLIDLIIVSEISLFCYKRELCYMRQMESWPFQPQFWENFVWWPRKDCGYWKLL